MEKRKKLTLKTKMGKILKEIKSALPHIESDAVEAYAGELDRILALKSLFDSEGGRELISVLRESCAVAIRKAVVAVKAGDTPNPFILDYSANLSLLSKLQDVSMEEEIRKQLDEAVKEAS